MLPENRTSCHQVRLVLDLAQKGKKDGQKANGRHKHDELLECQMVRLERCPGDRTLTGALPQRLLEASSADATAVRTATTTGIQGMMNSLRARW